MDLYFIPLLGNLAPTPTRIISVNDGVFLLNRAEDDDLHDAPIAVTLWDSVTGETLENAGGSWYWWTEGNGSCDCNRGILFDHRYAGDGMPCVSKRYYVVATSRGDIADFNPGYPPIPEGAPCR